MNHEHNEAQPTPGTGVLRLPAGTLHLEYTLANGQCFRWRRDPAVKAAPAGSEHWQGIAGGRVIWLARYPQVADGEDEIRWRVQSADDDPVRQGSALEDWLHAYLRLD